MTAAEIQALAKIAYLAYSSVGDTPWDHLKSADQERWRAVVRALLERALKNRT
jgi:hypothetical protein